MEVVLLEEVLGEVHRNLDQEPEVHLDELCLSLIDGVEKVLDSGVDLDFVLALQPVAGLLGDDQGCDELLEMYFVLAGQGKYLVKSVGYQVVGEVVWGFDVDESEQELDECWSQGCSMG